MKKIITLTMVLALVLGLIPAQAIKVHADDTLDTASEWALDEIVLAKKAYLNRGLFDKDYKGNATRAEFADFSMRMYKKLMETVKMKEADPNRKANFTDIDAKQVYIPEAYSYGVINGISDDTFAPDNNLSREQLCTMLYNVVQSDISYNSRKRLKPEFKQNYSDIDEISPWAKNAVRFMNHNGVILGSDNKLNPKGKVTRQEAILMGYRLYVRLLTDEVDAFTNVAMPITNNPEYRNMGIARVYAETVKDSFKNKVWSSINLYVNLMGKDYYSLEDGYYKLSYKEVKDIANSMYNDKKDKIKQFDYTYVPDNTGAFHQKVGKEFFYFFKKDDSLDSKTKIVKVIRDKDYNTVGFELASPFKKEKAEFYQIYFVEREGHVSSDRFYYNVKEFKLK